jgi:cold shock CspA family protein
MRQQGKIIKWLDDKGYGFVSADGTAEQIFAHISAFPKGQERPYVGEVIMFEIAKDSKKGLQAYNVTYVNRPNVQVRHDRTSYKNKKSNLGAWIFVAILLLGVYLYKSFYKPALNQIYETASQAEKERALQDEKPKSYRCEGKSRCTEMTSCEEATFYLQNCPGTIADGDGDGIPCEDQWCGH